MLKIFRLLFLILVSTISVSSTTLSGSFVYPDGSGVNGRLEIGLYKTGVKDTCNSGAVVPTRKVEIQLVNGVVTNSPDIIPNNCLSPTTYYLARVYDTSSGVGTPGGKLLMEDNWYITGSSPQNIGTFMMVMSGPNSTVSVPNPVVQNPTVSQIVKEVTGTTFKIQVNLIDYFTVSSTGISAPLINGTRVVDGSTYPTLQAAITDICGAGGGKIFLPPGIYPQNSQFTGICNSLYIEGSGRGTADNTTCPTTITSTITSGDLFNITALSHNHISNLCIKNIGTGGGVPIHLVGGLFGLYEDLYLSGPWANGIIVSPNVGVNSAIWNTFRNIHHTGYQTGASMVILDALNTTAQVINNNLFEYMTGSGGATGFGVKIKATGGTCPSGNVFINENKFSMGQASTSLGGGTGVSADNCTFRDLHMENQTIEGNNLSVSIGTGNAGFVCTACEISANTTNIPVDNSGITGRTVITGNIGTTPQIFAISAAGDIRVNSISFGAAGNNGINTWNFGTGAQLWASGTNIVIFNNTDTTFLKQIINAGLTFANLGTPANGTQVYCSDCNSTCSAGSSTGRTCFRENGAWIH